QRWVATANDHFWDSQGGGYFLAAIAADDLIARSKPIYDNAVPSGNGTMVDVLARLHYATGDAGYRERAEEAIRAFAGEPPEHMVNVPMLLMGAAFLAEGTQVVIAGDPGQSSTRALERAVFEAPGIPAVMLRLQPGQ